VQAYQNLLPKLQQGDYRSIAQAITLVENDLPGSAELLRALPAESAVRVVGVTGPPGAGKSTLVNALLLEFTNAGKKIAVISVDPSSPFNYGALLGDRIRMSSFYLHPNVFIRSLASRGSLGGLSMRIIEVIDVLRACPFDVILLETVGVGQSEVEIAGLADTSVVVMVPEAGDEVQTMKAGIMEIADIFVVNKGDRAHADTFVKNLKLLAHSKHGDWQIPVVKCVATDGTGIDELVRHLSAHAEALPHLEAKMHLMTEKVWQLLVQKRMQDVHKADLRQQIDMAMKKGIFSVYTFVDQFEPQQGKHK
jgi:LAO/AO transport system kinase